MNAYLKIGLVVVLCLLTIIPAAAQSNEPFTSGMVDIGGYSLYMECQGEGHPTVVMEGGFQQTGRTWIRVQSRIAQFTRVCTYDRAGLGGSDERPAPPDSLQVMADELHTLLHTAEIEGPYVLVAHSLGGFIVRLYEASYPEDVAGMVLVDTAHEREADLQRKSPEQMAELEQVFAAQPEGLTLESWQTSVDRMVATRNDERPLGDMPLVVLAAADPLLPDYMTAEEREQATQDWYQNQDDLGTLSTAGKTQYIEDTGHFIQDDQPDAVVDGVRQVVEAVRGSSTAQTSGTWTELAPMTIPRSELAAAVLHGKLYALAGYVDVLVYGYEVASALEVYDPATDTWSELAPMPRPRHHLSMAVYDGKLYAFGAQSGDRVTYSYDPTTDEWTEGADMPDPRYGAAAVVLDEFIYIVGGVYQGVPPLLRYDPVTDEWAELAAPSVTRDHVAAAVLDGKIYAIGGRSLGLEDYASTEIYDPATDSWTTGPNLNFTRAGFGATTLDSKIYVAGGEQLAECPTFETCPADAVEPSMEMYDPATGEWTVVSELPEAVHGMPLVRLDDAIYVVGGSTEPAGITNNGRLFKYEP